MARGREPGPPRPSRRIHASGDLHLSFYSCLFLRGLLASSFRRVRRGDGGVTQAQRAPASLAAVAISAIDDPTRLGRCRSTQTSARQPAIPPGPRTIGQIMTVTVSPISEAQQISEPSPFSRMLGRFTGPIAPAQ